MHSVVDMRTASQYVPIYSLNQQGWWMHANPVIRFGGVTIAAASPQQIVTPPQTTIIAQATPQPVPQRVADATPQPVIPAPSPPASTIVAQSTINQPLQRLASANP
jgi:hypothetical protein